MSWYNSARRQPDALSVKRDLGKRSKRGMSVRTLTITERAADPRAPAVGIALLGEFAGVSPAGDDLNDTIG